MAKKFLKINRENSIDRSISYCFIINISQIKSIDANSDKKEIRIIVGEGKYVMNFHTLEEFESSLKKITKCLKIKNNRVCSI